MTDIQQFLHSPLFPWLGWMGLGVIAVYAVTSQIHLKKQTPPRFSDLWWLNALAWFAIPFGAILAALLIVVLIMIGEVAIRILTDKTLENADDLRWYVLAFVGLLTALGGIIGTPFAFIRVWTTERQTQTAEQGLITDRINKATENLGALRQMRSKTVEQIKQNQRDTPSWSALSGTTEPILSRGIRPPQNDSRHVETERTEPNLEMRIGAIYSLERIAKDSPRDHIQIMEILTAYIRENAPATRYAKNSRPRIDIQAAIDVLGRRSDQGKKIERAQEFRLNLRRTNLSYAHFRGADFYAVDFTGSQLPNANFDQTDLSGAQFGNCDLRSCSFDAARIHGTNFSSARFQPHTRFGMFRGTHINSMNLNDTDLSEAKFSERSLMKLNSFGSQDSKLEPRMSKIYHAEMRRRNELEQHAVEHDLDVDFYVDQHMQSSPFRFWSPHGAADLETRRLYKLFSVQNGLEEWPFKIDVQLE